MPTDFRKGGIIVTKADIALLRALSADQVSAQTGSDRGSGRPFREQGAEVVPLEVRPGLFALVSLIDSFGEQLSQVFMLRVFDVDTNC
jgi:hypothetical protein